MDRVQCITNANTVNVSLYMHAGPVLSFVSLEMYLDGEFTLELTWAIRQSAKANLQKEHTSPNFDFWYNKYFVNTAEYKTVLSFYLWAAHNDLHPGILWKRDRHIPNQLVMIIG